jgi:hypothetical protein
MNDREQAGGGIQQAALNRRESALATRLDGECRARRSTGLTIFRLPQRSGRAGRRYSSGGAGQATLLGVCDAP